MSEEKHTAMRGYLYDNLDTVVASKPRTLIQEDRSPDVLLHFKVVQYCICQVNKYASQIQVLYPITLHLLSVCR